MSGLGCSRWVGELGDFWGRLTFLRRFFVNPNTLGMYFCEYHPTGAHILTDVIRTEPDPVSRVDNRAQRSLRRSSIRF